MLPVMQRKQKGKDGGAALVETKLCMQAMRRRRGWSALVGDLEGRLLALPKDYVEGIHVQMDHLPGLVAYSTCRGEGPSGVHASKLHQF